jgi:hypothetical protein
LPGGEVVVVWIERSVEVAFGGGDTGDTIECGDQVLGEVEMLLPGRVVVGLDVVEKRRAAGA